jgi:hypothetical protein
MYPRPVLESLEKRQFLSASAAGSDAALELIDAIGDTRVSVERAAVSAPLARAAARAPAFTGSYAEELTGTFEGEVKVKKFFFRREMDAKLEVTQVTDTGIVAQLTVDGHDVEGTFPGRLTPKGRFGYTHREDGRRVSIRGKVVPQNDRIVGKLKFKAFGVSAGGSFKMDRATPPPAQT